MPRKYQVARVSRGMLPELPGLEGREGPLQWKWRLQWTQWCSIQFQRLGVGGVGRGWFLRKKLLFLQECVRNTPLVMRWKLCIGLWGAESFYSLEELCCCCNEVLGKGPSAGGMAKPLRPSCLLEHFPISTHSLEDMVLLQLIYISGKVVPRLLRGQALYLKQQLFTEDKKREAKKERRKGEREERKEWRQGGEKERKKESRNFSSKHFLHFFGYFKGQFFSLNDLFNEMLLTTS